MTSSKIIFASEDTPEIATKERVKVKRPSPYKVLLLNDDYTTMDFVVFVLEKIFRKKSAEAVQIMMAIHNQGSAVCGVYPKQIAEAKVNEVHELSRSNGFPLRCALEPS